MEWVVRFAFLLVFVAFIVFIIYAIMMCFSSP